MMTKTQYAKVLIREFCNEVGLPEDTDPAALVGRIYSSSTLAVALETLGVLKTNDDKMYAASRGSTFATYVDYEAKEVAILSNREIIDMLPDTIGDIENTH